MKLKKLLLCLLCTVNFVTTYAQDRANSWSFSVLTDDIQLKKTQHKSKSENFLNIGGLGFGFNGDLLQPLLLWTQIQPWASQIRYRHGIQLEELQNDRIHPFCKGWRWHFPVALS